jgi:hypothetical protein
VTVEATPATSFKVAETQSLLQLFVAAFDDPTVLGEAEGGVMALRLMVVV